MQHGTETSARPGRDCSDEVATTYAPTVTKPSLCDNTGTTAIEVSLGCSAMRPHRSAGRRPRPAAAYEDRRKRMVAAATTGTTVLDLGYAQDPNPHLRGHRVGVDLRLPAPGAVRYDEEIVADVRELDTVLAGRVFDTLTCCELIEHLEEPYALLRSLHPFVAPSGRLVLTTPNPAGLPVVLFEWARSHRRFYTEEHAYYVTPRWVERMLTRTGWQVREVRGVGPWPLAIAGFPAGLSYQAMIVAVPA